MPSESLYPCHAEHTPAPIPINSPRTASRMLRSWNESRFQFRKFWDRRGVDAVRETLAVLKPRDLYPAWRCIDLMERMGKMSAEEAVRWKQGLFELMCFGISNPTASFPKTLNR